MSNFSAVEAGQGNKINMFGTFVEIGGVQYTLQQKAKSICKIADDNGVSHNVHIYQGTGQLPQPAQLQQRHSFSLSTFQGNYQNKPYTGYSGFWQDDAQVRQPQPQQGQTAPPQTQQGTQQARQRTNDDDMVRIRSMALSYAKDLVVAGKITQKGLTITANEFTSFIMTGRWFKDNQSAPDDPPPPPDDGIPF